MPKNMMITATALMRMKAMIRRFRNPSQKTSHRLNEDTKTVIIDVARDSESRMICEHGKIVKSTLNADNSTAAALVQENNVRSEN